VTLIVAFPRVTVAVRGAPVVLAAAVSVRTPLAAEAVSQDAEETGVALQPDPVV
jgi:hypothetical protein